MKHVFSSALVMVGSAVVASTILMAQPAQQATATLPAANAAAANDPAAGLFVRMCNLCHDAARITAIRRTRIEWEEVLNKMIEKGAAGTEKEFETIYEYVQRYYGKLYINNSTADEITTILSLSKKDADAIIAYRKANGAFADFDALKKVPDIDLKRLEEQKDAIAF